MTVTVVIPLYNKRQTIAAAVASALSQSYRDLNLVIVDDGSTDGSGEIVAEMDDPRITVIRQENAGPGAARNRGARHTSDPLLAFLDADDEWEPGFLGTAVARLEAHPECAMHVCGKFVGPDRTSAEPDNRAHGIQPGVFVMPDHMAAETLKFHVDFCHSSCIVCRRTAFDAYGGYYDKGRCTYAEDSYFWLQVLLSEPCYLDPAPLVWFHIEHSELGAALLGRHPRHLALTDPEPIRRACRPEQTRNLERLLAYYRLIETEKSRRVVRPSLGSLSELRRAFRWPEPPPLAIRLREAKLTLRAVLEPFRPPPVPRS